MSILEVKGLTKNFGGLCALSNVSLEVNERELIGLIGPNGAGKTTLFNLLTGVYDPSGGTITMHNGNTQRLLNGLKPYKITALGFARTFQNIRLFKDSTVLDNVKIAMHKDIHYNVISAIFRFPVFYREEKRINEEALLFLKEMDLEGKAHELAKNLPYGEQRRLEIARALAAKPQVLFLDEPAAGMNPQETQELTTLIHRIREKYNVAIVLIEHDMSLVMSICERLYVLDYGKCIASGVPEEIKQNERVIKAYLGEDL